jgi:hypothetical protein
MSEIAIDGKTQHNILPFTLQRPALTDPNFKGDLFRNASHETNLAKL